MNARRLRVESVKYASQFKMYHLPRSRFEPTPNLLIPVMMLVFRQLIVRVWHALAGVLCLNMVIVKIRGLKCNVWAWLRSRESWTLAVLLVLELDVDFTDVGVLLLEQPLSLLDRFHFFSGSLLRELEFQLAI